jgi:hypothetical protein
VAAIALGANSNLFKDGDVFLWEVLLGEVQRLESRVAELEARRSLVEVAAGGSR